MLYELSLEIENDFYDLNQMVVGYKNLIEVSRLSQEQIEILVEGNLIPANIGLESNMISNAYYTIKEFLLKLWKKIMVFLFGYEKLMDRKQALATKLWEQIKEIGEEKVNQIDLSKFSYREGAMTRNGEVSDGWHDYGASMNLRGKLENIIDLQLLQTTIITTDDGKTYGVDKDDRKLSKLEELVNITEGGYSFVYKDKKVKITIPKPVARTVSANRDPRMVLSDGSSQLYDHCEAVFDTNVQSHPNHARTKIKAFNDKVKEILEERQKDGDEISADEQEYFAEILKIVSKYSEWLMRRAIRSLDWHIGMYKQVIKAAKKIK